MVDRWVEEKVERMDVKKVDKLVGSMADTRAETMVVKTAVKKVHRLVDVMVGQKGF